MIEVGNFHVKIDHNLIWNCWLCIFPKRFVCVKRIHFSVFCCCCYCVYRAGQGMKLRFVGRHSVSLFIFLYASLHEIIIHQIFFYCLVMAASFILFTQLLKNNLVGRINIELERVSEREKKTCENRWTNDEPDVINMNHDEIVLCFPFEFICLCSDFLSVHLIFIPMSFFFFERFLLSRTIEVQVKKLSNLDYRVYMLVVLISKVDRCY